MINFQAVDYSNSFLLYAIFTSLVITITLLFDNLNDEQIKKKEMSTAKHALVLFCQVIAISLFISYLMLFVFQYGSGNFTPCQKVVKKCSKNNFILPHTINIIIMIVCFALAIFLVKTTKIDFYPKKSWF